VWHSQHISRAAPRAYVRGGRPRLSLPHYHGIAPLDPVANKIPSVTLYIFGGIADPGLVTMAKQLRQVRDQHKGPMQTEDYGEGGLKRNPTFF
jgi:hypothetical protein